MIAVDTNVVLRLFINDDKLQAGRAKSLFDDRTEDNDAIWIADVVLAELVWALERTYKQQRADIVAVLKALSNNTTVVLESTASLTAAIALYEKGPAGFVDCLLALKATRVGCDALRSFDTKIQSLPGVALL